METWLLVSVCYFAFASDQNCKRTDIISYIAKYSQKSILGGLSPNSLGES